MIRRQILWLLLLFSGLFLIITGIGYFFPRTPRVGPLASMPERPGPVLLFAPHSDDEALAAAGLLQMAQEDGAQPQVILVTGGDAFKLAAQRYYKRTRVTPEQMITFGEVRLEESRSALLELGMPPRQLTFLGYPDQALHRLWLECWAESEPCTSKSTGRNSVPYTQARTPGAAYAGETLLRELKQVLRETQPSLVLLPHPNESHVDHWALANFVTAALEELRRTEPNWTPPEEWLYLVHRGNWPAPKGLRPREKLLPPKDLTGLTTWHIEPLTPEQVERKEAAIRSYQTQTVMLRRYMESFIRANELYGTMPRVHVPDGLPDRQEVGAPPWTDVHWHQVMLDPRGDTAAREVKRSADVLSVWAARDEGMLYVAARMAAPLRSPLEIHLYAKGFRSAHGWGGVTELVIRPGGSHQVRRVFAWSGQLPERSDVSGAWVRTRLPLAALGAEDALMLNVETRTGSILIDRTAWRVVSLDGR